MPLWEPDQTLVDEKEWLGRRVFDKASKQYNSIDDIKAEAFDDSRLDEDLSFDRLGHGNPTNAVISTLTKLADKEAEDRSLAFFGWIAQIKKNLRHVAVSPDPLSAEKDGVDNMWHAAVDRSAARTEITSYHFSNSLYVQFKKGRYFGPVRAKKKAEQPAGETISPKETP